MFWLGCIGLSIASEGTPAFQLVGVYDASSVIAVSQSGEQEFLWQASKAMEESCGMAKARHYRTTVALAVSSLASRRSHGS